MATNQEKRPKCLTLNDTCTTKIKLYFCSMGLYLSIHTYLFNLICVRKKLWKLSKWSNPATLFFFLWKQNKKPQRKISCESSWRKRKRSLVDLQLRHGWSRAAAVAASSVMCHAAPPPPEATPPPPGAWICHMAPLLYRIDYSSSM